MNFGSFGAGFGSFGGSVGGILPALTNLTSWLKAPTQDGTTLANSKGVDAELTDVNCLSFDGDTDHIDLSSVPSDLLQGVFDISFDILVDDSDTSYQRVIWFIDGDAFFRMQKNNGSNTFDFWATAEANVLDIFREQNLAFTPNVEFNFRAVGDGTDVKVYYDDVLQNTTSITAANKQSSFSPTNKSLGKDATSFKGKLANFKMSSGGVLHTHLPIAEGSGTKVYDVSGNGNHGTIDGATWTTEDGIESWNHEYGFDASAVFDGSDDYVDTGLAVDTAVTKASFTIKPENDGTHRVILALNNKGTDGLSATFIDTNNKLRYRARSSGSNPVDICQTTPLTAGNTYDVVIDYESNAVTINGVNQTFTASSGFTHDGSTILIGSRETVGSLARFYAGEIHSLKLETSSGVIRDFVPSDDKLYDKVNGVYYSNDGTGDIETKRYPALNTKTKQVATFDGVADYVDTGVSDQLVKKYSVTFTPTEITNGVILGLRISRPACFELMADGSIRTGLFEGEARDNNTGANQTNTTTLVAGTKYTVEVDYDNNEIKINDVVQSTSIVAGRNHTNDNVWIGGRRDSGTLQTPFKGIIHSVKLESATAVLAEYDFQNDIGTTTVQDLTTNDNDGTVTVGSGGLDSFWGTRIADNDGVLVSADYATGNTSISNPSGFVHNNSECGLDMVTNDKTAAQLFAIDNSTATQTFVKKDANGNITQVLDYSAALTGNDLTRTRNYVG